MAKETVQIGSKEIPNKKRYQSGGKQKGTNRHEGGKTQPLEEMKSKEHTRKWRKNGKTTTKTEEIYSREPRQTAERHTQERKDRKVERPNIGKQAKQNAMKEVVLAFEK